MTGEELKALREDLGWTAKRMAEECGMTQESVANWEAGGTLSIRSQRTIEGVVSRHSRWLADYVAKWA